MALPYVGVSASANNSTIYVTGHFYNNGSTWQGSPGCRFTLSIDGIAISTIKDGRLAATASTSLLLVVSAPLTTIVHIRFMLGGTVQDFRTEQIMRPQLSQFQLSRDRHTQSLTMPTVAQVLLQAV